LRVAIKANPLHPTELESATDTAAAILSAPAAPMAAAYWGSSKSGRPRPRPGNGAMQAGLIVTAALVGWAATRRRQQARRAET
jgi:hypothetical protein